MNYDSGEEYYKNRILLRRLEARRDLLYRELELIERDIAALKGETE